MGLGGSSSLALAQAPPTGTPGLVAYYPFDGDARDYSGNGNHGTNSGAVFVPGRKGQALKFDGVNNYVSAPLNINPDVMPQMTMVAWVKADKVSGTVISHDNGDFDRTIDIDFRGGGTGWSAFSGSGAVLGYHPVTIGEWVFTAAVYDQNAKKVRLHVDDAVYEKAGTLGPGWQYINIGRNPSFGGYFSGAIDEVRIYNYALSPSEIAALRAEVGHGPGPTLTPAPTPQATPTPPTRQVDTTLIAEERMAAPGSAVSLPVRLERASRLGSLSFSIRYDPAVVSVSRVDGGNLVAGYLFQSNTRGAGIIRFGIATQGTEGISGDGPVAYVVFTATGPRGSSSAITLGDLLASDSSGGRIILNLRNGRITTGAKVKGDYDGDGRLTAKDALAALKMSVGALPEDLNLDMDNDGRVSAEDARRILAAALSRVAPQVSAVPASQAVRPAEGGQVAVSGTGTALDRVRLVIPPRALRSDAPVNFRLSLVDNLQPAHTIPLGQADALLTF